MNLTPLGLRKPIGTDGADLRIFIGENMDIIDSLLNNKESKIYKQQTAPSAPMINDLWINTTAAPFALSIYINSAWSVIAGGGSTFVEDATHRFATDAEKTAWNAKADASIVTSALSNKVDVVIGKGLSTNDYTTAEKNKLSTLSVYANQTVLDGLSDSAGSLYYKGAPIASGGSVVLAPDYVVVDAWNTTGTRTLPIGDNYRFYINNTGNSDLTFTINGITLTVKATEEFEDIFDPFTQVIVTATSTFDANVSGIKSGSSLPIYSVKDYFSGSANTTRSFSGSVYGIVISNDGLSSLTYTVNGLILTVKAGDVVERYFDALTEVTINSTVAYRAYIKSGLNAVVTGSNVADTTAPANATNLAPSNVTATTLTLSWNASVSSDIASYDVYNGVTLLGNTATTNFSVTGLTEKTQYTFTVKAKDSSNNVASGTPLTTTTADVTAPANATNPLITNITQTTLTLNWTASVSTDVASYDVYNGATLLGNVTATTYSVTGLTAGTNYTFNIKAKDASNNMASSATVSTITIPLDVNGLTTSNLTSTSLTVIWSLSTGASSYDVYNGATLLGNTTTNSYDVSGLAAGTQYTFKVIAKNISGASTGVTTIATTSTTTVQPVTQLTAGTATINSIPVTWIASSSSIANQEVAYSTDGTNYSTPVTIASNATSYTFTGLTAGTTYTLRVVAIDASANRSVPATIQKPTATAVTYTASANPPAGTYGGTQNVALSCNPNGATIYYTVNGATPTTSSSVYSGTTIPISATTTLKFFAQDSVGNSTTVQTANYTIDTVAPSPPNGQPVAGTPTSSTIPVSWTLSPSTDVANYEVAHSTDNFVNNTVIDSAVVNASSTSYTVTGLAGSTPYTIRVVAIDGAGNRSTGVTVQATTTAPVNAIIFQDNFDRANATTLGANWNAANIGITSNQAYNLNTQIGGVTTSNYIAVHDTAVADNVAITFNFAVASNGNVSYMNGIVFRYQDANNYWAFGKMYSSGGSSVDGWTLVKVVAGATTVFPTYTQTVTYPLTLKVELRADMIYCYVGATQLFAVKDATFQTQTKHGISMGGTNSARFDDFRVDDISGVAAPTLDTTAPDAPTGLIVNTVLSNSFKFYWNKSNAIDVLFYDVYLNGTLHQSYPFDNTTGGGTQVNKTISVGITASTSYTVAIQSRDGSGNVSTQATINTKTAPAPVANLAASSVTSTSLTLTWDASASANSYRVTQNTTRLTNPDLAGNVLTYAVTGLAALTTYTFKVGAIESSTGLMTETSISVTTP
jgi:chitodextrinase